MFLVIRVDDKRMFWFNFILQFLFMRVYWSWDASSKYIQSIGIIFPVMPLSGWFGMRFMPKRPKVLIKIGNEIVQ